MAQSVDNFSDLKELGIDCDSKDSLTLNFNRAANYVQKNVSKLSNDCLLILYGFYKQGSEGPCNTPKPSWYDMRAKAKWEAWKKLGELSREEAKSLYIKTVTELDPSFTLDKSESWVRVSVLKNSPDSSEKTVSDFIKEGDKEALEEFLKGSGERLNDLDENGMGLIHWAADSGKEDIIEILLKRGVDIDLIDSEGQTALHYASSCGHVDCVRFLLEKGARKDLLDKEGFSPLSIASDESVKELLER